MFHEQYLCRAATNQENDGHSADFALDLLRACHTLSGFGPFFVTPLA
jgi:hypothetical protein